MKKIKIWTRTLLQMIALWFALYSFGIPNKIIVGVFLLMFVVGSILEEYNEWEKKHDNI